MKSWPSVALAALLPLVAAPRSPAAAPVPVVTGERTTAVSESVDWDAFLRPSDMVWTKLPTTWSNAPILGNGMAGVTVRKTDDRTMSWEVGRADIKITGRG